MNKPNLLTGVLIIMLILIVPMSLYGDRTHGSQFNEYLRLARDLYSNQLEDRVEAAKRIVNNAYEFIKNDPSLNQLYIGVAANILGSNDVYIARSGLVRILNNKEGLFEDIPRAKSAIALGEFARVQRRGENKGEKIGNESAKHGKDYVKPLGNCLLNDPNGMVRALCAQSLGKTSNSDALPFLYCGLSDPNPLVQLWSAKSIIQITGNSVAVGVVCSTPKFAQGDPTVDLNQVILSATQTIRNAALTVTTTSK